MTNFEKFFLVHQGLAGILSQPDSPFLVEIVMHTWGSVKGTIDCSFLRTRLEDCRDSLVPSLAGLP